MPEQNNHDSTLYFDLLQQIETDDIYYTATYTLRRDEKGNIILYPDARFLNKQTLIFSHNSLIFEGEMPEMMLIAVQSRMQPKHLHDLLQLRLELR